MARVQPEKDQSEGVLQGPLVKSIDEYFRKGLLYRTAGDMIWYGDVT